MKDLQSNKEAFANFGIYRKPVIDEDELRSMLRKYAPGYKEKENEEIFENPNITNNGKYLI